MFTQNKYPQIKWIQRVVTQNRHFNFIISIDTMDNPGWSLKINLPQCINNQNILTYEKSEQDWINAFCENNYFICYCGPLKLSEAITVFKSFLESNDIIQKSRKRIKNDEYIDWLQNWYLFNCDGDWEHSYGIRMTISYNNSFKISFDLENIAYLESDVFELNTKNFSCKLDNYYLSVSTKNGKLAKILFYAKNKILMLEKQYGYFPEHAKMKEFTRIQREYEKNRNF